jgi:hypothetical protein
METVNEIPEGIFFVTAKSEVLEQSLNAVQNGLNQDPFDKAQFIQLIVTNEVIPVTSKNLTIAGQNSMKIFHVVIAVVRFPEKKIAITLENGITDAGRQ